MARVTAIARQVSWYWCSLMGDNHYQHYMAYRRAPTPARRLSTSVTTGGCATTQLPPIHAAANRNRPSAATAFHFRASIDDVAGFH